MEPEKGNSETKETHMLLKVSGLNYIRNVEERDLPASTTEHHDLDVVVCDGFVGNVLLKFYEAIAPLMIQPGGSITIAPPATAIAITA